MKKQNILAIINLILIVFAIGGMIYFKNLSYSFGIISVGFVHLSILLLVKRSEIKSFFGLAEIRNELHAFLFSISSCCGFFAVIISPFYHKIVGFPLIIGIFGIFFILIVLSVYFIVTYICYISLLLFSVESKSGKNVTKRNNDALKNNSNKNLIRRKNNRL